MQPPDPDSVLLNEPSPDREEPLPDLEERACANCGHALDGLHCSACGQKATVLRQPLHLFLGEAFTEYFGFDGRLWTSLRALLFHPGRLTRAYFAGQRVRYLRPLRLYLSATLLFFFLLSILDPVQQVEGFVSRGIATEQDTSTVAATERVAELDSILATLATDRVQKNALLDSLTATADSVRRMVNGQQGGESLEQLNVALEIQHDSLSQYAGLDRRVQRLRWQRKQLAALPPDTLIRVEDWELASEVLYSQTEIELNLPAWMPRSRPLQRLMTARTNDDRASALADYVRNALGQLPTVMFLLLPVFAFLLKLIYVRRGWFYSEHLVFALHTHAFAFLVFALMAVLIGFGGDASWVSIVTKGLLLSLPVYFFVAQKRVYEQSWLKTGLKALMLAGLYSVVVLGGLVLAILLASAV